MVLTITSLPVEANRVERQLDIGESKYDTEQRDAGCVRR